ncbi:MAG: Gfo/Idh/MocA family oxidoreductase [Anaerolineae bacterium]|nr:Gfo/Idh/MocA family oxidoreductase [Anaerolineae bacterium]
MEKVKVALIGAGSMANSVHYPSLAEMDDVDMAALCDLVPQKLEETSRRFGIRRTYTDYREMIEKENPDAVYVLMPPHHLFDITVYCLQQGKHVFVEKPPAVTTFQTMELANWAAQKGCTTLVGFNRRFIPLMTRVRDMQREAGALNLAVSTFYKAQPEALYYNGVIDCLHCDAIHAVDALRWMGGDVRAVASDVGASGSPRLNRWLAVMDFEDGGTGVLLTNWDSGGRVHTFELHAPGFGAFVNPDPGGQAVVYRAGKETLTIGAEEAAESQERHHVYGFFGESRHFIDCVKEGIETECGFADAAKTMALADDILASCL